MTLGAATLIKAVEADLVGPLLEAPGEVFSTAGEFLRVSPSRWYLRGFLVPRDQGEIEEPDDADDLDDDADDDADDEESSKPAPTVRKVRRLLASMGLSVFTPPAARHLVAHVSWAAYQRIEVGDRKQRSRRCFQRALAADIDNALLRYTLRLLTLDQLGRAAHLGAHEARRAFRRNCSICEALENRLGALLERQSPLCRWR